MIIQSVSYSTLPRYLSLPLPPTSPKYGEMSWWFWLWHHDWGKGWERFRPVLGLIHHSVYPYLITCRDLYGPVLWYSELAMVLFCGSHMIFRWYLRDISMHAACFNLFLVIAQLVGWPPIFVDQTPNFSLVKAPADGFAGELSICVPVTYISCVKN